MQKEIIIIIIEPILIQKILFDWIRLRFIYKYIDFNLIFSVIYLFIGLVFSFMISDF